MNNLIFKKVPLEDINQVYKIYCNEEQIEIEEQQLENAYIIYKEMLEKGSYTFGCYIDNEVVGVINVYKNKQYYPTAQIAPYVHLECFIVDKMYQNKGIGKRLLKETINNVIEEGCSYIIAQSSNEKVQKMLYETGLTETNCKDYRKHNCHLI